MRLSTTRTDVQSEVVHQTEKFVPKTEKETSEKRLNNIIVRMIERDLWVQRHNHWVHSRVKKS